MPTRAEHIDQAERNEAAAQALQAGAHYDWAITTLFYAALHLVDAYNHPNRAVGHPKRMAYVAADVNLLQVYAHYRELYNRSRDARYECVRFTDQDIENLRVAEYGPIRRHVRGLLGI
jgi:hypothetical protein